MVDRTTALDRLLRTPSLLEQEALRRQALFDTTFSRLQQDLNSRRGLLEQITGSNVFSSMRSLDSMPDLWWRSSSGLDFGVLQVRASEVSGLDRMVQAQATWIQSLSAGLERTTFGTLTMGFARGLDFSSILPQIEVALGSAALEFPETFEELTDHLEEVARDLADGISRAAVGEAAIAGRSIRGFLTELLEHYDLVDEQGKARVLLIIAVVLIAITSNTTGESLGGEWNRFRDAPAQGVDQALQTTQAEELQRIRAEIAQLREIAEHPPRPARVVRRAWLRSEPNAQSLKVGPVLEVGVSLVVFERRDGWVRVEAESTPGDVRTGWVYGPLTQYE